ncbi:MAG TPA: hypothetical protein VHZ52_11465 [Acidobacteriaceae bacterium]|jgi:hypothetical protein|nr:hypothetical protein [Acidobacteriaceae bacterium]
MKRIFASALLVAATFLTAHSAVAQSHAVKVDVPFRFTIHNTTLPAGKYTISSELLDPATLIIRDSKNTPQAIFTGMDDPSASTQTGGLVFHQYGDLYFLSEIRFASASKAVFLPPTKQEERVRKHNGREYTTVVM